MDSDSLSEAQRHCEAALASMQRFGLGPTPRHFAVWYEYHAGSNLALRQTLGVVLSNNRDVDRRLMADLYDRFFCYAAERQAVQTATRGVRATLNEVVVRMHAAGEDATRYGSTLGEVAGRVDRDTAGLPQMIARLAAETEEMSAKSAQLGRELSGSAARIAALEKQLGEAHRAATTDGLTELPNRRAFDVVIRDMAGEAMNSGEDLSLLMIDIDHFKRFNDTWGHMVGDAVLRLVATALAGQVRARDHLARYGGEEFAMLLPQTPLATAASTGDALRRVLEGRRLSLRGSAEALGNVTVSIGAARYEPGEALGAWIERADGALYRAKREGRNRVVAADGQHAEAMAPA